MVSNAETAAKIKKYENFVETKLKVDLRAILDARDKLYTQISDYVTLRNNIKTVQDSKQKKLKTMVNLGSEFWVQAVVPDTSTIMVNIGLGFHAELSLDEVGREPRAMCCTQQYSLQQVFLSIDVIRCWRPCFVVNYCIDVNVRTRVRPVEYTVAHTNAYEHTGVYVSMFAKHWRRKHARLAAHSSNVHPCVWSHDNACIFYIPLQSGQLMHAQDTRMRVLCPQKDTRVSACIDRTQIPHLFHICICQAVKFTHAKEKLMNVKADRLTKEAAKVSSHIKMVLTTIGELAQLSQIDTNKKPRRPQW